VILRPYQKKCVEEVLNKFENGSRATLAIMPTGTGKTICFGDLAHRWNHGRVLVVAHRQELIYQAADKIEHVMGERPIIEMGEMREASAGCLFGTPRSRVLVTSIQTANSGEKCLECEGRASIETGDMELQPCPLCLDGLTRRMQRFDPFAFGLLIIDECHHAPAATYRRLIEYFGRNPELRVLGVSATPHRHDRRGLGAFDSIAFEYDLPSAICDGWLVDLQQQFVVCRHLDFSRCRISAGDLSAVDLERLMTEERLLHEHVTPVIDIAGNRPTLFFASGVRHAELAAEIFNRHRRNSAICIHGRTPTEQRRHLLDRFHRGEFQYLCGCGVFLEGFDEPRISVVACARPTRSQSLYCQMVGRGTRPINPPREETAELRCAAIRASSKPACLVVDFTGNSLTHKLVSTVSTANLLSSGLGEDVAERAVRHIREKGGSANTREAIEAIAREDQLRREEEAARRASVKAKAKFHSRAVDPFNALDTSAPRADARNRQRRQPSSKQVDFLERHGISTCGLSRKKAGQLIGERIKELEGEPCTEKQARLLERYGLRSDLTKREAGRAIGEIVRNGWRVPDELRARFAAAPDGDSHL
jgi:superfamily II DNA or RNA helicase